MSTSTRPSPTWAPERRRTLGSCWAKTSVREGPGGDTGAEPLWESWPGPFELGRDTDRLPLTVTSSKLFFPTSLSPVTKSHHDVIVK